MSETFSENNTNQTNYKTKLCKFYQKGICKKDNCSFIHSNDKEYKPKNRHSNLKNKKNTEDFTPMTRPTDLRLVYDQGYHKLSVDLTDRDLLIVPNIFSDYRRNNIYKSLIDEITNCELDNSNLLKLWHGNDKIDGTHYIADDKLNWKSKCPTFHLVLDRLKTFFNVQIKATRFNLYKDSNQWKPFHHDAAAFDEKKANTQNITIAVSFGHTRYGALEFSEKNNNNSKTTLSFAISDGEVYAFTNTTNKLWKHGILQDNNYVNSGRISIIIWGWIDGIKQHN